MIQLAVGIIVIAGMAFLWERDKRAWTNERAELLRRIAEPQQVVVENRPKRPKVETVSMNDDAAFKRRREARGQ